MPRVVFATTGKMPLGRIYLNRICSLVSPMATAPRTKVRSRRDRACARINLALPGQLVMPITIMTLVMLLPNSATISIIRKKVGTMRKALISSEITKSVLPPKYPAAPPMSTPSTPEISEEMSATCREVRMP